MNSTRILLLIVLNCAPLLSSAGALPNLLENPIFNRPTFYSGGGGLNVQHLNRLAMVGNLVYVADGPNGLAIYDVTDPARPQQLAVYKTSSPASAVRVTGTQAWVDTAGGAVRLDVSNPNHPQLLTSTNTVPRPIETRNPPATGRAIVAFVGDRAYISRDDGVVELVLHGLALPTFPLVAREHGADPISVVIWLPNAVTAQQPTREPRPKDVLPTIKPATLVTRNESLVATEHSRLPVDSVLHPVKISGVVQSGLFRLSVAGVAGQTVRVQRSSSLTGNWEDWHALTLGETPAELVDEDAAGADQTFYRAVSP